MMSERGWGEAADEESIERAAAALRANNIEVFIVDTAAQARERALETIPEGAEVMNMTSVTVDQTGFGRDVLESGRYRPVRAMLNSMDAKTQGMEMRRIGAAHEWAVGSVHAVTEDGKVMVASATGSQLPGYAYGAANVLWIVGAQKIVKDVGEGLRRIQEHTLPLEDKRAMEAYGVHSSLNKILIFNRETAPGRTTMIIIRQSIGF